MGKTIKLLLFVMVTIILLSLPNVISEELKDVEDEDVLEGEITPDGPSRPKVLPDLSLSPEDIVFSYERIEEECILVINATITNFGFVGAYAYIEFYDGVIDNVNLIGSGSLFVKSRNVNVISLYWKAEFGEHTISVLIKESVPRELIKRNNAAEKTVSVSESDYWEGSNEVVSNENGDDSLDIASVSLDNPIVSTGVAGSCMLFLFVLANKHYMWFANLGAIPLYSRITNGQVLKQDTRKNIYEYIASNPGVYFSSVMKDLKLKNGVTSYHLEMLEREGYVKSKYIGLYRRLYVNGASTQEVPQSKIRREIIQIIVDNPGISQTEIASSLGVSNQVVNYHIGILGKANFIKIVKDGFRTKCFISAI